MSLVVIVLALILDQLLGEPRRLHPLVGFGFLATRVEQRFNKNSCKIRGVLAWLIMVGPPVALAVLLQWQLQKMAWPFVWIGEALILYLAIGRQSLIAHARAVYLALKESDLNAARANVALLVTRDTSALNESGISTATVESVLENGSDALFASLFWFVVAGLPGVVLHRASNTLDAMWGYRSARFENFGWAAARCDDVLNLIPARLTALSYALSGGFRNAMHSWRTQAPLWSSPNAGPVMAAGAGALNLQLGGAAIYAGEQEMRPLLGCGRIAQAADIPRALALLNRSLLIWLLVLVLLTILLVWLS